MTVVTKEISIETQADCEMVDITAQVEHAVEESKLKNGIVTVFCTGSTGAVSTMEFEPGLQKDIKDALEVIAPAKKHYKHHETWGCDNGRSHVRATIIGPSLTVPFTNKKLALGTWQQIVFIELDTRGRDRKILVQIVGE